MYSKQLLMMTCMGLLGGLRLTSTKTTSTLVAAMSLANQDLERYFRPSNGSHLSGSMTEERIAMDYYTYAFLNYTFYDEMESRAVNFTEEKARYGEGRIFNVTGELVHITDASDIANDYACSQNIRGTLGKPLPHTGVPWIALIRRGFCKFEDKVKHVYNRGASGVIVFNDKPVMVLEKMQIKGRSRNITAVITYQDIGLAMVDALDNGYTVMATIAEGNSGMRPVNTLNRTSVLFVSVSFIVLMIVSLVWLIFYYIQRFRYLQAKDQQSRNLCSVTKKAIMKIPTKTGKMSDEKDADSDCCAICIEAYKSSDVIRILPCKHEFHKNCIDPWLIEHRTCPMCKLDVLKFYGYVVGDQINQNPSPQHQAPNFVPIGDNDVPIIVVAVAPAQQQSQSSQQYHQQQQADPLPNNISSRNNDTSSNTNNSSNSSSNSSRSNTNVAHGNPGNASSTENDCQQCNCATIPHNSECRQYRNPSQMGVIMQVPTASRQVTDV